MLCSLMTRFYSEVILQCDIAPWFAEVNVRCVCGAEHMMADTKHEMCAGEYMKYYFSLYCCYYY